MSTQQLESDKIFMQRCLELAHQAMVQGEVPVGACVVQNGKIIGEGANCPIATNNPVAHAEILALQAAAKTLNNYRLLGCKLYVSLEPCTMCAGALIHARIAELIFSTADPKSGAIVSVASVLNNQNMNHRVQYKGGLLEVESARLLTDFFRIRRKKTTNSTD